MKTILVALFLVNNNTEIILAFNTNNYSLQVLEAKKS